MLKHINYVRKNQNTIASTIKPSLKFKTCFKNKKLDGHEAVHSSCSLSPYRVQLSSEFKDHRSLGGFRLNSRKTKIRGLQYHQPHLPAVFREVCPLQQRAVPTCHLQQTRIQQLWAGLPLGSRLEWMAPAQRNGFAWPENEVLDLRQQWAGPGRAEHSNADKKPGSFIYEEETASKVIGRTPNGISKGKTSIYYLRPLLSFQFRDTWGPHGLLCSQKPILSWFTHDQLTLVNYSPASGRVLCGKA